MWSCNYCNCNCNWWTIIFSVNWKEVQQFYIDIPNLQLWEVDLCWKLIITRVSQNQDLSWNNESNFRCIFQHATITDSLQISSYKIKNTEWEITFNVTLWSSYGEGLNNFLSLWIFLWISGHYLTLILVAVANVSKQFENVGNINISKIL